MPSKKISIKMPELDKVEKYKSLMAQLQPIVEKYGDENDKALST